jgi:hypothetical protein
MLTHKVNQDGVIEIVVDGAITKADYESVVATLEREIAAQGKLRLVEVIDHVGPIDPAVWWRDVKWVFGHLDAVARAAVVTDSGWIGPITRAAGALMPAEIRVFRRAEADAAREWARG